MDTTPKGNRLHIALFGRTNVGKSTLLNLLVGQDIAITSPVAGTTTDVVEKAAELLPLGPVLFLDTAGLDDTSALADLRIRKTEKIFDRADIIIIVTEAGHWSEYEETVREKSITKKIPYLIVINKIDLTPPHPDFLNLLKTKGDRMVALSAIATDDREKVMASVMRNFLEMAPDDVIRTPSLIGDLLPPGGLTVLVVPIDLQAPKGRLILPQVQTIRDVLDNDASALIVKERELAATLDNLKRPPELVVCDSQAILKVSADTPKEIPCTTFSILFARQKGDLVAAAEGVTVLANLQPGDKLLIAESCAHHPLQDDIGRVKIPRWLRQYLGMDLQIDTFAGRDYPDNLQQYKAVIHCGACMLTRREMLNRIQRAREAQVAITNYGITISFLQGVARRVLSPFPSALLAYDRKMSQHKKDV
ncbi:MAG: tRNA modification GTPase MnmE [Syntrophus sp. SKADARSKE-3]|nr:tRNA modification GTPase MnmE [Syntrophus sp. SKADARSKE-3]